MIPIMYESCKSLRLRRSLSEMTDTNFTMDSVDYNYNKTLENLMDYEEESTFCAPVFFLLDFFHAYYIPFIILLGLIGNLLSCVVFLNTHLKMRSSSYYLAALATTDFTFLVSLLFVWLNSQIGWLVFNEEGWCEIVTYVSAVCSSLSVWLIVAFTVERFIAVQYPLHRPYICTVARAKTIILVLVVLALGCHSYVFVTAGVIERDGELVCDLKQEYMELMRIINMIDTVASLMAPLILIVVMNTMIMRNFLKFSRRFKQAPATSAILSNQCPSRDRSDINLNQIPSNSGSNNGIILGTRRVPSQQSCHSSNKNNHSHHSSTGMAVAVQTTATAVGTTAPPVVSSSAQERNAFFSPPEVVTRCIHIRSSSRNLATPRNQQSITKMLLLISTVFVLLNLPSYAIRVCIFFFTLARRGRPALLWCLQQFFMLLYYTNFSINFLLYAMCGITFRRCLDQLLRKCLKNITRYLGRRRRNSESS